MSLAARLWGIWWKNDDSAASENVNAHAMTYAALEDMDRLCPVSSVFHTNSEHPINVVLQSISQSRQRAEMSRASISADGMWSLGASVTG